jgi:hypothetical protein
VEAALQMQSGLRRLRQRPAMRTREDQADGMSCWFESGVASHTVCLAFFVAILPVAARR